MIGFNNNRAESDASDATYHIQLEPPELRPILDTLSDDTKQLILSIVLIGRATGIVKALRVVSFSAQFSRALNAIVRQQLAEPLDQHAYDAALECRTLPPASS